MSLPNDFPFKSDKSWLSIFSEQLVYHVERLSRF